MCSSIDTKKNAKNAHNTNESGKENNQTNEIIEKTMRDSQISEIQKKNITINTDTISSCQIDSTNKLPVVNIQIGNLEVPCLIDSGASVSLLDTNLFNEIKQQNIKIKYISRQVTIFTVDKTPIPFTKAIQITIRLDNKKFSQLFYVTKNKFSDNYAMILGFDFMSNNKIILDIANYQLHVNNQTLALTNKLNENTQNINNNMNQLEIMNENVESKNDETNSVKSKSLINTEGPKTLNAKLVNKITIAPHSTKYATARCHKSIGSHKQILINQINRKTPYIIDHALHETSDSNTIFIPIHNTSDQHIHLNKNMKIVDITTDFLIHDINSTDEDIKYEINNLTHKEIITMRQNDLKDSDFSLDHLSDTHKREALKILRDNAHVFSKSYQTLGENSMIKPQFKLLHDYPINTKPYPLPHSVKQHAQKEINELLRAGIIQESTSNYSFPVIFVKKKNSKTDDPKLVKYRMAIDYRLINQITPLFPFKLPDIKALMQDIAGHEMYSVLDLKSAFFQIKLQPEDSHKLAFTTDFGMYEPRRLPFGSRNSSTYFALLMDKCLKPLRNLKIRHFLDDIIVPAHNFQDMSFKLTKLFKRLIEFNLTIDPAKTQLYKQQINFLGYQIDMNGSKPSQANINKITNFPKPKNHKQVKSFLGLTNYFRELIENYAQITFPLVELTKKNVEFKWTEEHENAFQKIQQIMFEQPHLFPVDHNKHFFLITDASKIALSAILAQKDHSDQMRPIEFYSRKLKEPETRYPSIKRELLAIHDAIIHFRQYLYGIKFTLITDAKPLTYHLDLEKQSEITARWLLELQDYDFTVKHTPGEGNPADFLSRAVFNVQLQQDLINDIFKVDTELTYENLATEQKKDKNLKPIIDRFLTNKNKREDNKYYVATEKHNVLLINIGNKKVDNIVKSQYRIMAPKGLIKKIIKIAHTAHFGTEKTYETIKQHFYWYGMRADIKNFCQTCTKCNTYKNHKTLKVPLQDVTKDYAINEYISIDIIGPLPKSVNKKVYALTIIDNFSRHLEIVPLTNITMLTITKALAEYFARYGICRILQTDNGKQFTSTEFTNYLKTMQIEHRRSSIYYPQSNGTVERCHSTLKQSIAAMANNNFEWDIRLLFFKLAYNNTKHQATGFAPAFLYFNRLLRTPFTANFHIEPSTNPSDFVKSQLQHIHEIRKIALQNMQKLKAQYLKESHNQDSKLEVGDKVFLKQLISPRTFEKKFSGPYTIMKIFRNQNYLIKSDEFPYAKLIKIHIGKLFKIPNQMRNNLQDSEDNQTKNTIKSQNNQGIPETNEHKNLITNKRYNLRPRNINQCAWNNNIVYKQTITCQHPLTS